MTEYDFEPLKHYDPIISQMRYQHAEDLLKRNRIPFTIPSPGHIKITSKKNITSKKIITIMFYPKSGTIIWKKNKDERQRRFTNRQGVKIMKKLHEILRG